MVSNFNLTEIMIPIFGMGNYLEFLGFLLVFFDGL